MTYLTEYRFVTKKTNIVSEPCIVSSSNDAFFALKHLFDDFINIYESFYILLLQKNNKIKGFAKISQGGRDSTVVDVSIIAKYAVEALASGVILAHNHPSGNLQPSNADIEMTKKIKKALDFFDIQILDHIIITDNNYFSFADNGLF